MDIDEAFQAFMGQRRGIVTALTQDSKALYAAADPACHNLSLFGRVNGTWFVAEPVYDVRPSLASCMQPEESTVAA